MAIVFLYLSVNSESCFHYSGIYFPFLANNIATVYPFLFLKFGLCSHSYEATIPLFANSMATVLPSLSYKLVSYYWQFV